ncbi:hypothetical protein Cgig2_003862 [Carnegiea gigantea]|uniref:Uncharacterized protein n=1 Tax=Carnegiea gigantea TaxID=171969 RepID=A0A9Q1QBR4_9CARY|nr:hypothetical protein Cgig2_003862 [Carnegiea gigantea]
MGDCQLICCIGATLNFMQASVIDGTTYAKIEKDDVLLEIDYWQTAVLCSVLGSNPPIEVMEGYLERIWKSLDIDRGIASLSKLGSTLGILIKTDKHTMEKTRLSYARLLIDILVDGFFHEFIDFINDQDVIWSMSGNLSNATTVKCLATLRRNVERRLRQGGNGEKSRIILLCQERRAAPNHKEQTGNMTPKI